MSDQIELTTATDMTQLKALAYDRLVQIELLQNEVRAINERIGQLQTPEVPVHNGRVTAKTKT